MKMNLWITLPLSLMCFAAYAQSPAATTTTTTTTTPATTAPVAKKKAAPAAGTSTVAAPKKEEAPSVKYSFVYSAEYDLQAQTQPDGSRAQSLSHMFRPGISYGDYTAVVEEYYNQDLVDSKSIEWTDPAFAFSKKAWTLGDYFKLGPSASLVLPLKDATRNEMGLLYNVGAGLKLSLNTKNMGLDSWSFAYQVNVYRNFTQYDTNAKTGAPNLHHKIRNRVTFGYDFTDQWSFFNLFDFNSNYSVNGVVTNSFFSLQSLGYQVNDVVNVSIAHTNGGPFLKAGTYENNLKFYDEENSTYAFAVEVAL